MFLQTIPSTAVSTCNPQRDFVAADDYLIERAREEGFNSYDVEEKEDCKKLEESWSCKLHHSELKLYVTLEKENALVEIEEIVEKFRDTGFFLEAGESIRLDPSRDLSDSDIETLIFLLDEIAKRLKDLEQKRSTDPLRFLMLVKVRLPCA